MAYRTRTYYTDSQKALMWERWRQGWTLHQIAQLFNRAHTSVQKILSRTGGIQPPERSRSSMALTFAEREEISRAMAAGFSIRSIALILGRAASTISREIKRNGGPGCYRATQADQAAWDRARRPKRCRLVENRGWRASSLRSFDCNGLRSRLPVGSSILIRATRPPTCPTRPSTAACSFKPAGR
jgi:IS30 family transposase